jgi:hypothetical protein
MRRLSAIALFAALVIPAVLPFLAVSSPDANLPACCRRDGRHHCAMMAMMERASHEISFRTQPPACPYRSQSVLLARSFSVHPSASMAFYAALVEHPAIHAQTVAARLVSAARSHRKRGPPSSFAC